MITHKPHRKLLAIMLTIALLMGMPAISTFAMGDNTLGESGVTLGASGKIITEFEPLAEEIRIQRGMNVTLPQKIGGKVDNLSVEILVTWTIETDPATVGLHVYTAKPDDTYTIAEGVSPPTIAFMRVSLGRMAGVGTENNPLQITNAAQLAEIAALVNEGKLEEVVFGAGSTATVHLKLMNNIDLSAYKSGEGWVPIGTSTKAFNGSFDGGGKTVTNLYINRPTTDYQGLFGRIDTGGEVKNLGVVSCDITGESYVGGVAGVVSGKLTNCYATGSVSGNNYVGGVAGRVYGSLENCYATASVSGTNNNVGGVAGQVDGTLTNCYATGSVSGNDNVGGVAGFVENGSTVTNCAALNPSVKGTSSGVGRVVGRNINGTLSDNIAFGGIINNAGNITWDNDTHDGLDGETKTAADIAADGTLGGLFANNNNPWTTANGSLPGFGSAVEMPLHLLPSGTSPFLGTGTSANPYQITTPEQLARLATLVNAGADDTVNPGKYTDKHYQLMNNIDLSAYKSGQGWVPIGHSNAFNGNFDGDGKTVTNLYIDRTDSNLQGLFGFIDSGGAVKNLGVVSCNITGKHYVGGVAGQVDGTLTNCYATGLVRGTENIGGVVGYVGVSGTLTNCYATGSVRGSNFVGGVVGYVVGSGTLTNCYATGSVSGLDNVGGVAGFVSGTLTNCYATGSVSGANSVGGVAGRTTGTLTNCYATGSVSGNNNLGGVAGYAFQSGTVKNCAALNPSVKGTGSDVGRVVGKVYTNTTPSDNIAFGGIINNAGTPTWGNIGASNLDGETKSADELQLSTGFPSGFNASPWKYEAGKLPGFGSAVPMPMHLFSLGTRPFAGGDGTGTNPYQIATAEQLAVLATLVNAGTAPYANADVYYKLTNHIDLSTYKSGEGWVPIGHSNRFKGNFDGGGKTVTNLYINRPNSGYQGLFGHIDNGGVVKNLGVVSCNITSKGYVGGVAGWVGGTVTNCYATGSVSGTGNYVGGVAGVVYGTVTNCYATATVSGNDNVGGVAGWVGVSGTLTNCYATATVSGNDSVGGVAGFVTGTVTNCYATGSVGGTDDVGGVAGWVDGTVTNCAALNPSVKGIGPNIGRVAGRKTTGTFINNYAFSGMTGGGSAKTLDGLDGKDMNATQVVTATFWKTAANWNTTAWSDTVWIFTDGKLPILTGLVGQNGEAGLYLSQKDAEVLTVEVNSNSYVYTGSPIEPITAKFGTTVLIKDEGYTVLYTNNTNVGTATADVVFIGNYRGTKTVTFAITKATPTGLTSPTAAAINYRQTLADSALSGGTGAGTWAWADSTIVPTVGNSGYAAIFTPTDTVNYETVTETIGITVNPTAPNAPASVIATAGDGNASVNFTPPSNDGGRVITGYTVTTNDGKTATGTASPITVTGLTNGVSYTFTVIATNSEGNSPASTPSNAVTPMAVTIAVTGVSLDKSSIIITAQGATESLIATVSPSNATNSAVSWSSSNTAIATVTNGVVTPISAGKATVTVTTNDGGKTATCDITVLPAGAIVVTVTRVSVAPKTSSLTVGETAQLTAKTEPHNATFANISWLSSNTAIGTVDGYGKVTAVSAGTATITAKNNHSGLFDTAAITVTSGGSSSSSGGSSSSSGGSNKADIAPVVGRVFAKIDAIKLFNAALATKPEGATSLSIRAQNFTKADKSALVELATLAEKNGVTLTVHFDTVVGKAVIYRISVNPATTQTNLDLTAKIVGGKITLPKFSPAVEVAVKMPAGVTMENLKITQNGKDVTTSAKPWLDKNGYLHFTTELAGAIVISNGALVRR